MLKEKAKKNAARIEALKNIGKKKKIIKRKSEENENELD